MSQGSFCIIWSNIFWDKRHRLLNSAFHLCYDNQKYADEVKKMKRQLPKNVRQIGNVSDSSKIYVEDYVDTFFNQLCEKADQSPTGAFLVGEIVQEQDQDYIYVYGAIQMKEVGMKGKDIHIDEATWKNACEKCKEYFPDGELLGWSLILPGQPLELNHNLTKIHQRFFSREKSLLILKDSIYKEEKFYIHKFHELMECGGHYIYYEKNVEMQNYMIENRKKNRVTPSEVLEDKVTKDIRSVIREKMEVSEPKGNPRLVYAASTFLVLVLLVIGVTMVNNYDRMKAVQGSLDDLAGNVVNQESDKDKQETEGGEQVAIGDNQETGNKEPEQGSSEQTVQTGAPVTEAPVEGNIYIVEKGDTLATISKRKYGDISHIEEICEMNGLEDGNLIFIGQKLLLP